jgi:Pyridoxamine 5'-phosphate oxidase
MRAYADSTPNGAGEMAMIDIDQKVTAPESPRGTAGAHVQSAAEPNRVTLDLVLAELRRQHFAVLSTADEEGIPHSAGVNYGVSEAGGRLALYIMTRKHLRKTRNIARNPKVSLVIPVARRFLWFLPPATIQVHGRAEILEWTDAVS